jgi:hypothetical protein
VSGAVTSDISSNELSTRSWSERLEIAEAVRLRSVVQFAMEIHALRRKGFENDDPQMVLMWQSNGQNDGIDAG